MQVEKITYYKVNKALEGQRKIARATQAILNAQNSIDRAKLAVAKLTDKGLKVDEKA